FTRHLIEGKSEYEVKKSDALRKVALAEGSTMEYLKRANRLMNGTIHPGDRLLVFKFDFLFVISLSEKILTVWHGNHFFKQYPIDEVKLPSGVSAPFETGIRHKAAWKNGEAVQIYDSGYSDAVKWIQTGRPGVVFLPEFGDEVQSGFKMSPADIDELNVISSGVTTVEVRP
ncbi:MAG: LysM peptidoglycan-binding domain-containing protein, partial [Verrucomicrobiota bacterium]